MTEAFPFCQTYRSTAIKKKDFQKMDQQTRGKLLIHGTKHHTDKQLLSLELSCIVS